MFDFDIVPILHFPDLSSILDAKIRSTFDEFFIFNLTGGDQDVHDIVFVNFGLQTPDRYFQKAGNLVLGSKGQDIGVDVFI